MLPIRDSAPRRRPPVVVVLLVCLNAAIFALELALAQEGRELAARYALVPARLAGVAQWGSVSPPAPATLITSLFLHAGLLHLAANMWFLVIFGDNVEDAYGHSGFAVFYLAAGVAAGLAHAIPRLGSTVPCIGASGAVSAVMGAYFVLHPTRRIRCISLLGTVDVSAALFLAAWLVLQVSGALGPDAAGVAWWAHIGGFVFGILATALFVSPKRSARAVARDSSGPFARNPGCLSRRPWRY